MSDHESSAKESSVDVKLDDPSDLPEDIITDTSKSEEIEEKKVDCATMNATTSEDSEYETLEEDNAESSKSSRSRRSSFSSSDQLSDGIGLEDEREDGDGQEENSSLKDKKLDDDEDRRNPQYIPKKGFFYEHDDRTMADENEESNGNDANNRESTDDVKEDIKNPTIKKGKVWIEKNDRWSHDLYNEDEQKPKSTQELIDTYGYDIRNEEAPPKARRRRRYGRGPNKYTRNWEDEDAYARSAPQQQRRVFHNNREEFPELGEKNGGNKSAEKNLEKSTPSPQQQLPQPPGERERERMPRREWERPREEKKSVEREERIKPLAPVKHILPPAFEKSVERKSLPATTNFPSPPIIVSQERKEKEVETPKVGRGRGFRNTGKPRPSMEFVASKGRGPLPAAFPKEPPSPLVPDSLKHAADILAQDFSHIYISSSNNTNNTNVNLSNIVEETIIPSSERRHRHNNVGSQPSESAGGRPKRYSTQRRNLPETTPPPTYSPPQPHNIPYYTQPPPTGYVPAPVYNEVAPPPVTSPPMQLPLGVFLPPGPPPTAPAAPPYPPPPLLNYLPPPTYQPMALQPPEILPGQFDDLQAPPELYQGQQFEELGHGPAELYQTPGGITYYSTQTQSVVPRPNPPRRVKLAIPIVPPPDNPQQRGGSSKQHEVQPAVS